MLLFTDSEQVRVFLGKREVFVMTKMQEWLRAVLKLAANQSTSRDEGEWRIEHKAATKVEKA